MVCLKSFQNLAISHTVIDGYVNPKNSIYDLELDLIELGYVHGIPSGFNTYKYNVINCYSCYVQLTKSRSHQVQMDTISLGQQDGFEQ